MQRKNDTHSITGVTVYIAIMETLQERLIFLLDEIDTFLGELKSQPVFSVHGIRKRTKNIRALLALSPDSDRNLKKNMRDISRILAPYRDAQVNWETYQLVISNDPAVMDLNIQEKLEKNPFYIDQGPDVKELKRVHDLIALFKSALVTVPTNIPKQDRELTLSAYHSARKSLKKVKKNTDQHVVHAWRKKTKQLGYQLRFLFGETHDDPNHPLNLSDDLGHILGEIHDLDVLNRCIGLPENAPFRISTEQKRLELMDQALKMGNQLYLGNKSNFNKRLSLA